MKKILLVITLVLVASIAVYAEAQPEATTSDEVIEVTTVRLSGASHKYFDGDTPEDNIWTQYMLDKYKIKMVFNWVITGKIGDYNQKLNLSVMSGEIPDTFDVPDINVYRDYAQSGHLQEIKPTFDRLAADPFKERINVLDGMLWKATMVDGKNYSIPGRKFIFQDNKALWVRQDWLDKLGLDAPTTLNEMYTVATAFAKNDPDGNGKNDTVGFGFDNTIMSWMASLDPFFGMFGSVPGTWLKGNWVKDGKGGLIYSSMLPGTKEALVELSKWYADGIVNQDFVTQKESVLAQLVGAGTVGMYFGSPWNPSWPHPDTKKNVPGAKFTAYPIPDGPSGSHVLFDTPIVGGAGRVFAKDFKYVERIFEYLNDKAMEYVEPGDTEYNTDYQLGKYTEPDPIAGGVKRVSGVEDSSAAISLGNDPFRYKEVIRLYEAGYHKDPKASKPKVPIAYWRDLSQMIDQPEYMQALQICVQEEENALVNQYQAASPGEVHQRVWAFLKNMELEYTAKIIMGELPVSAWDEFVAQWEKSGGVELTKEVNDWWDSVK